MLQDGENKIEKVTEKKTILVKTFIILGVLVYAIVLTILKFILNNFEWLFYIILMLIGILVVLAVFIIPLLLKKEENKKIEKIEKLPQRIALVEARKLAKTALTNEQYANVATICKGEEFITLPKSRNTIYVYHTEALYKKDDVGNDVYILINMHFPELRDILFDPSDYKLKQSIRFLGNETEEEPQVEEIETRNDILGVTQIAKKPLVKQEEKKEDLE